MRYEDDPIVRTVGCMLWHAFGVSVLRGRPRDAEIYADALVRLLKGDLKLAADKPDGER